MKKNLKIVLGVAVLLIIGGLFASDYLTIHLPKASYNFKDQNPVDIIIQVDEEAKQFDEVMLSFSATGDTFRDCKCILVHYTLRGLALEAYCKSLGYKDWTSGCCGEDARCDLGDKGDCPRLGDSYSYFKCYRHVSATPDKITLSHDGVTLATWTPLGGYNPSNEINIASIINKDCSRAIYCTAEGYDKEECTTSDMECSVKIKVEADKNYGQMNLGVGGIKTVISSPCDDVTCPDTCFSSTVAYIDGICRDGNCYYTAKTCDDNDISTTDACVTGNCIYTPILSEPEDPECFDLWWFDNDNMDCSEKEFCGTYVYSGLRTFDSEADCEKALGGGEIDEPIIDKIPASFEELTYSIQKEVSESNFTMIIILLMIGLGAVMIIWRKRLF